MIKKACFSDEDTTILWLLHVRGQGKVIWKDALIDFKGFGRWTETKIIVLWQILQSSGSLPWNVFCLSLQFFALSTVGGVTGSFFHCKKSVALLFVLAILLNCCHRCHFVSLTATPLFTYN